MFKVSTFLRFLSDLNPQKSPARLALYNFLKGFSEPDDTLDGRTFELFFQHCMDFPHWADNKVQLSNEIRSVLEHFNGFFQQKLDLSGVRFPEQIQIIELESVLDQREALSCHLNSTIQADDKFQLIPDQGKKMIAVVLRKDRSLEVRTFERKFTVRGGLLEPLRKDLVVFYTPSLELSADHLHRLEVAPYITAQFSVEAGKVSGAFLRGFVFQKMAEMKGEALSEQTRLLWPLKRLEQFFVDRRSDREYQELVQKLERTRALVQQGDPEARKWSPILLGKAETLLEQVYVDDKILALLARDLRQTLQLQQGSDACPTLTPIAPSDLTN